jgi:hypothetical protein
MMPLAKPGKCPTPEGGVIIHAVRIASILVVLLLPGVGAAQDSGWARQPRSEVQVGLRAVGIGHLGGIERVDVEETTDLGRGVGGELGVGARLGGWLVMELRAGYARLDVAQGAKRRDLWAGVALRGWLVEGWSVSPVVGAAVLYHRLSFDVRAVGIHGEAGLGWRVADALTLTVGVAAAPYVGDRSPDLRFEAFLACDVAI